MVYTATQDSHVNRGTVGTDLHISRFTDKYLRVNDFLCKRMKTPMTTMMMTTMMTMMTMIMMMMTTTIMMMMMTMMMTMIAGAH